MRLYLSSVQLFLLLIHGIMLLQSFINSVEEYKFSDVDLWSAFPITILNSFMQLKGIFWIMFWGS